MSKLVLCLGSNVNATKNMDEARRRLKEHFEDMVFTHDIVSTPVGIEAAVFTNCMAQTNTTLSYDEIHDMLKQMERQCGDTPEQRERNQVCMDIDLLQLGRTRYKKADWKRPYIRELKRQLDQLSGQQAKRNKQ